MIAERERKALDVSILEEMAANEELLQKSKNFFVAPEAEMEEERCVLMCMQWCTYIYPLPLPAIGVGYVFHALITVLYHCTMTDWRMMQWQ